LRERVSTVGIATRYRGKLQAHSHTQPHIERVPGVQQQGSQTDHSQEGYSCASTPPLYLMPMPTSCK
jgi:hypothetical protein